MLLESLGIGKGFGELRWMFFRIHSIHRFSDRIHGKWSHDTVRNYFWKPDFDTDDHAWHVAFKPQFKLTQTSRSGTGSTKSWPLSPEPQSALQKAAVNDLKLGILDQVEFETFQNMWETSNTFRILPKKRAAAAAAVLEKKRSFNNCSFNLLFFPRLRLRLRLFFEAKCEKCWTSPTYFENVQIRLDPKCLIRDRWLRLFGGQTAA